jgi:hypothetical protein
MKLVEANWNPSDRQLRQFALICVLAIPLLCWLWISADQRAIGLAAAVGLAIGIIGLLRPSLVKYIFLALMVIAIPIGMVVSEVVLAMIFFGVFTPLGLVFRCMGRDALEREIKPDAKTYWQDRKTPQSVASYFRQS